jgi:hypothetical protein
VGKRDEGKWVPYLSTEIGSGFRQEALLHNANNMEAE